MRNINSEIMPLLFLCSDRRHVFGLFSSLKGVICYVGFTSRLFNCLQAVFVRDAFGPEQFEFPLDTVLRLQQHTHISLQYIELSLQIEPTADDKRRQQYELNDHREIDLPV